MTAFDYNNYGLLEKVCLPDDRCITYTYDPLGRRSSKLVNGKGTEKYCWKDMLCLQAACTGEDEEHVVFNYSESEKNVLQPTSLSCNGKKYFLAYNHVGTLLAIADKSGSIVHIEETDSFGRRLSHHKLASVAMLSFGGGQLDDDTGLVHFLFRDYYPTTGFFIQRDPLGLRGGDMDVYGYCLDDPVNLVDPLGLKGIFHKLTPEEKKFIHHETTDMMSSMLWIGKLLVDLPSYAGIGAEIIKETMEKDPSPPDEASRSIRESRAPTDHYEDSLRAN